MTDASESIDLQEGLRQSAAGETVRLGSFAEYADDIDLDELEKFTDQWANNPHNGDTIYSLAWMEGPESARTEASATLTVSGLLALVARLRAAEARIDELEEDLSICVGNGGLG